MDDALKPRRLTPRSEPADLDASQVRDLSNLVSQLRLGPLSDLITVKGISTDAKRWVKNPSICFGTLSDGQFHLAYRIPASSMPAPNEEVVLRGELCVQPHSFELQLHGDVVGAWAPKQRPARQAIPLRERSAEGLFAFLEHRPPSALGVIATDTGWRDVEAAASTDRVSGCAREIASFASEVEMVAAIRKLANRSAVQGIVLARGGGPRLETIGNSDQVLIALIESKLPFYTALGHSNDLLLLDKHADQSFSFPGDFGHRLRRAMDDIQEQRDLRANLANLSLAHNCLQGDHATTTQALRDAEQLGKGLERDRENMAKANADQVRLLGRLKGAVGVLAVAIVVLVILLAKR